MIIVYAINSISSENDFILEFAFLNLIEALISNEEATILDCQLFQTDTKISEYTTGKTFDLK